MGRPYWGYENYLMGSTVTARTASSVYPATNLGLYTMHRWRSASKAVVLDGSADYFWILDAAWNSYTGDFTFEFLIKPTNITQTGTRIISKYEAAADYAFLVRQYEDDLVILLSSNGSATAATVTFAGVLAVAWHRYKLVYDASAQEVALYVDGIESGRATVDAGTGTASVSGTIPTSIYDSTAKLSIGASAVGAGGTFWAGSMGFVGLDGTESDNGGYLYPATCDAYYNFDNSDGTDSSGNGRTLTEVSLDSGDYSNCTAYNWLGFTLPATQDPTFLFLDRRHNITSTGTVRLLRDDWFSTYDSVSSITATAGQPVVKRLSSTTETQWWLEINDPDNSDGYIEIPHVWLGSYTSMERAHLRGYDHNEFMPGNPQADVLGNPAGYIRGGQVWDKGLTFRCNATDFSTMQSVWDEAGRHRPVVFCEDVDNEDTQTWLVKIPTMKYQHIYTTNRFVKVDMQEVAVGL